MCQFGEYSDIYEFSLKFKSNLHYSVVHTIFSRFIWNSHSPVNFLYRLYIRKHPSGPGRQLQRRKGQENQCQSEAGRWSESLLRLQGGQVFRLLKRQEHYCHWRHGQNRSSVESIRLGVSQDCWGLPSMTLLNLICVWLYSLARRVSWYC